LAVWNLGKAFGTLGIALGSSEDLVALTDVGETIVKQGEDIGGDLFAETISGAQILIDPDLQGCALLG
jgi:hypothetical protein